MLKHLLIVGAKALSEETDVSPMQWVMAHALQRFWVEALSIATPKRYCA